MTNHTEQMQTAIDNLRNIIHEAECDEMARAAALEQLEQVEINYVWREYWADYAQVIIQGSVPPPRKYED